MTTFNHQDIISIKDFSKEDFLYLIRTTDKFKKRRDQATLLKNKVLANLFYEPSTRTKFSFESAIKQLGGKVLSFADIDTTSVTKGESLYDTIKTMENYADIFVMRHNQEGAARFAAEITEKPVINAGDGANQHPTQTLLDLYTINECQKKLTNLTIAIVGDLKYGRTTHSLVQAMSHFKPRFYFISPAILKMPDYITEELKRQKIRFTLLEKMDRVMDKVDVLYMTRIQKERFSDPLDYEKVKGVYRLTPPYLKKVKKNFKIMHPLPRVDEIAQEIDNTVYAYYFQQAQNGLYVRQTLLSLLLGKIK